MVDEPQAGSPAAKAGIEVGDVITAVDGKPMKDPRELARTIGTMAPDTSVKLDILRKGENKTLTVNLGQVSNEQQAQAETGIPNDMPHLGLMVEPANDVAGLGGKGVVVTAVDPDGRAAEKGITTGDIILDVGGKGVANAADVQKAMSEAKKQGKHDVLFAGEDSRCDPLCRRPARQGLILGPAPTR